MSADRPSGDFGSTLRAARERRGVSLRQIANATKISVGVLEALERNDISRLPGGIFGRAFVRSYAIEVGLDPEETIQDFIAQFPHDAVVAGHPTSKQTDDNEALESERRTASTFLLLIGVSGPLALLVVYLGNASQQPPGRAAELTVRRPAVVSPTPTPAPVTPAPIEATPTPAPAAASAAAAATPTKSPRDARPSALEIGLVATADCQVTATVDGQVKVDRVLQADER